MKEEAEIRHPGMYASFVNKINCLFRKAMLWVEMSGKGNSCFQGPCANVDTVVFFPHGLKGLKDTQCFLVWRLLDEYLFKKPVNRCIRFYMLLVIMWSYCSNTVYFSPLNSSSKKLREFRDYTLWLSSQQNPINVFEKYNPPRVVLDFIDDLGKALAYFLSGSCSS